MVEKFVVFCGKKEIVRLDTEDIAAKYCYDQNKNIYPKEIMEISPLYCHYTKMDVDEDDEKDILAKNVMECPFCHGAVHRYEHMFQCSGCKAVGDLMYGIMTRIRMPDNLEDDMVRMPVVRKLEPGEWIDAGGNVREAQSSGNSRGVIMHSNIVERYKKEIIAKGHGVGDNKDDKESKMLTNRPGTKCVNCGHDVMVYHHPLSSGSLIFHDNGGIFSRTCSGCKCKDPNAAETNIENDKKNT